MEISMNQANLHTAVNTSVLKKSMDTNEVLMDKLIEGMPDSNANAKAPSTRALDIYA